MNSSFEDDKGEEFISTYRKSFKESKERYFTKQPQNFLWLLFAKESEFGGDKYDYYSQTKLSFYGKEGKITTQKMHDLGSIYPFLNPNRLRYMEPNESSIYDPFVIDLTLNTTRGIQLLFSSGLGIWGSSFRPEKDNFLDIRDVGENGLIDNQELYIKNVPMVKKFISQVAEPIIQSGGKHMDSRLNDFLKM